MTQDRLADHVRRCLEAMRDYRDTPASPAE